MEITKKYLKLLIAEEFEIIQELRKEIKQGKEHYKRSYPISISQGKIKAFKELLKNG